MRTLSSLAAVATCVTLAFATPRVANAQVATSAAPAPAPTSATVSATNASALQGVLVQQALASQWYLTQVYAQSVADAQRANANANANANATPGSPAQPQATPSQTGFAPIAPSPFQQEPATYSNGSSVVVTPPAADPSPPVVVPVTEPSSPSSPSSAPMTEPPQATDTPSSPAMSNDVATSAMLSSSSSNVAMWAAPGTLEQGATANREVARADAAEHEQDGERARASDAAQSWAATRHASAYAPVAIFAGLALVLGGLAYAFALRLVEQRRDRQLHAHARGVRDATVV